MGEMDELLAQLKAEYAQPEKSPTSPSLPKKQPQSGTTKPIDNLLAEVKAEFEGEPAKLEQKRSQSTINPKNLSSSQNQTKSDNLIQDLQQEDKAERERKQQDRERRRTEALKQKAREWLDNLDPKSDEGLWFEEFAYAYESKLEAAVDYLQALRESHFLG